MAIRVPCYIFTFDAERGTVLVQPDVPYIVVHFHGHDHLDRYGELDLTDFHVDPAGLSKEMQALFDADDAENGDTLSATSAPILYRVLSGLDGRIVPRFARMSRVENLPGTERLDAALQQFEDDTRGVRPGDYIVDNLQGSDIGAQRGAPFCVREYPPGNVEPHHTENEAIDSAVARADRAGSYAWDFRRPLPRRLHPPALR